MTSIVVKGTLRDIDQKVRELGPDHVVHRLDVSHEIWERIVTTVQRTESEWPPPGIQLRPNDDLGPTEVHAICHKAPSLDEVQRWAEAVTARWVEKAP